MNRALRAELLDMAAADQEARRQVNLLMASDDQFCAAYSRLTDPEQSTPGVIEGKPEELPPVLREMLSTDSANLVRLRQIVDCHGWPGRRLVGDDGAAAAWLLALHADSDRDFQRNCLALLSEAAANGDADPRQVAWLTDRLLLADGKDQHFGTVILLVDGRPAAYRLADPEGVEARRSSVELSPLRDELERVARNEPRQDFPCAESCDS
jgi:hypothetical protein